MNFSLLNDDGTLGQLANTRVVVLRGSTTVGQLFSPNIFPINSWIKTALENRGFSVNAVRSSAAGWIGYQLSIEIELNVFNNFTAEEARANAITAIEAYTANYGVNKVFYNTTLSVASDAYVPPSQTTPGGTVANPRNPRPSPSPPSVYDVPAPGAPGSSNFLDNLGLGLGISTPVVILGGGLLLLLMLKR